jgi:hypothetical protein
MLTTKDSVQVIRVGGLDDYKTEYKPEHELFAKSKLSWVPSIEGAVAHQTMP